MKRMYAKVKVFISTGKGVQIAKIAALALLFVFLGGANDLVQAQATDTPIVGNLKAAIDKIASLVFGLSTGAVIVGVGTGTMLKKFSMGKPDRIEQGNKLIRDSILGWMVLNGLLVILSWINSELLNNAANIDVAGITGT